MLQRLCRGDDPAALIRHRTEGSQWNCSFHHYSGIFACASWPDLMGGNRLAGDVCERLSAWLL
jgi:hypothetical protein